METMVDRKEFLLSAADESAVSALALLNVLRDEIKAARAGPCDASAMLDTATVVNGYVQSLGAVLCRLEDTL